MVDCHLGKSYVADLQFLLRFGPFEADCRTGELRKNGLRIRLAPQAFQVLALLAERDGELVTREEMRRVLWPNQTFVDFDHSINTAIQRIRSALSDSRENPRYVETLSRRGHRFLAPVERMAFPDSGCPDTGEPATTPNRIGETIGQYRIVEVLGEGGMGIVYKAQDLRLGRAVALKFLSPGLSTDASARASLESEARAASSLNHPNVCTIYAVEAHEQLSFIAMEYLEGQTLREHLTRTADAPLPVNEILDIVRQIAAGLAAAHERGIIHRDIKPENVFITRRGEVKILDFGLAQAVERNGTGKPARPAATPGTVSYMSPEQARCEPLDARTDLFSFGVVLREMATGRVGAPDSSRNGSAPPGFPPGLWKLIGGLVEPDRNLRCHSAAEAHRALTSLHTLPRRSARRWSIIAAAALALVLLTGLVSGYRYLHSSAKTRQKSIVIAEFNNSTGDSVFDTTLRLGLATQLEQTPYLSIVSDQRISHALELMEQPAGARLTASLARQVCQRTGGTAAIDGSISSLGRQYVVTLTATDCQSGETLAREQGAADGKERVLAVLGTAAGRIRSAIGESLPSVKEYNTPVEDVTTSSLDALHSYSLGMKAFWNSSDSRAAIPFFERALELDPKFAMGYLRLGGVYDEIGVGETRLSGPYFEKAFAASNRVSVRERFDISTRYYEAIGDMPKAVQACQVWAQTFPNDATPLGRMANIDLFLGKREEALEHVLEHRRRAGENFRNYGNLVAAYLNLNRFDDARKSIEQAGARKLEPFKYLYVLGYLQNDAAIMRQATEWASRNSEVEDEFLNMESDTEASYGHLGRARELSLRAIAVAKRNEENETTAAYLLNSALREAEFGNASRARQAAEEAVAIAPAAHGNALAALALARAGFATRARELAVELARKYPDSTLINIYFLPTIRAAIALDANNPSQAIHELEATTQYDFAAPNPLDAETLYPIYLRGEAYRQLQRGAQAVEEFRKYPDHAGSVRNFPLGVLARLQLARAYAVQGDTAAAQREYQTFLGAWHNADSDIPILQKAKHEYSNLLLK